MDENTTALVVDPEPRERWLNRTVVGAGITSALGDFSYETTNVVLPGFLAVLGVPPLALGSIEGIADAVSSFTKLGAGYFADRLGARKALVVLGYALPALMQALMALATGWPLILAARTVGWLGRGIRGPLRDSIVAESINSATRGRAFGFHRAADTVGAVVGPVLGIALLGWAKNLPPAAGDSAWPFRVVFWLALIPGVASVLSFGVAVQDARRAPNRKLRFWTAVRGFPRPFRRYLGAVGVFGLGDFAHTLLILAATQLLAPRLGPIQAAQIAGLLYVGRNLLQTLSSYPIGVLADRWGHHRVLVGGYALGALMAALLSLAFFVGGWALPLLVVVFALAGIYVAVQDAVEAALAADLVASDIRNLGYGVLGTVNGVGDFVSSAAVGVLWSATSPVVAFGAAAAAMFVGSLTMGRARAIYRRDSVHG